MKKNIILTIGTIAIIYIFIYASITFSPVLAETANYTLAANETVVYDFAGLKTALTSSTNGITTVYFGADITMGSGGITINSTKTNVTISGINPLDPNQTTPYTLTDYSSSTQSYAIYINSSGIKSLLVSDLNIVGKNWYGSFSVLDSSATADLVITYERVNYIGPQFGYHRQGKLHFIDCAFTINETYASGEFAEAHDIVFKGDTTIDFQTETWGVFWHTNLTASNHGNFEIADDSSLTVIANNRNSSSTAIGLFGGLGGYVDIIIGANAALNIETSGSMNGISSISPTYFSSFTIKNGGAFNLTTTKTAASPVMQMNGNLFIEDNASFKINGYGSTSYAELEQRAGNITVSKDAIFQLIARGSYPALLRLYGVSLLCYDPASVLLYNTGGRTIESVTTAGKLHAEAEQINYWTTAGLGGFDDSPENKWKKADDSNFVIDGTISLSSSTIFDSLTSNYSDGDSPGAAPDKVNFNIVSARVLSFGRLDLIVYKVNEASSNITGTTTPGAAVRASFTQNGTQYTMAEVTADSNGFYSIPLDTSVLRDTIVIVRSNINYLTTVSSVVANPAGTAGKVEMTVPAFMGFKSTSLSTTVQIAGRRKTGWGITVMDTRGTGNGWRVYASAPVPLTFMDAYGNILNGALVFVDNTGTVTPLDKTEPLLIERHTTSSDLDVKVIHWAADRGILARIPPDAVFAEKYKGSIEWILADTP